MKRQLVEYAGGKCVRCGYDNSYAALQFHHKDDSKEFGIGSKVRSIEYMKAEVDKCELLCANCHAEHHAGRHWPLADDLAPARINAPREPKLPVDPNWRYQPRPESRKVERPPLEEILKSVEEIGYSATGRKYSVSDNAVRKWIKMYEKQALLRPEDI